MPVEYPPCKLRMTNKKADRRVAALLAMTNNRAKILRCAQDDKNAAHETEDLFSRSVPAKLL